MNLDLDKRNLQEEVDQGMKLGTNIKSTNQRKQ